MDNVRGLVEIDEALSNVNQQVRGRMARVVASDGHLVTVELPAPGGWDGPLGPYPATMAGLTPGTVGVLDPLRGGQWLFVAVGVVPDVYPLAATSGGTVTTTDITTYQNGGVYMVAAPPGLYRFAVTALGTVTRSVATGSTAFGVDVESDVETKSSSRVSIAASTAGDRPVRDALTGTIQSNGGNIGVRMLYRGASTAGTTYLFQRVWQGTFVKIG